MILSLFDYFVEHYNLPNIFTYISFRSAMAAVCGFLIALLPGRWVIDKLRIMKFGQEVRSDGPKTHLKKSGTPTMGGLLIILSVLVSSALWLDVHSLYNWILLLAIAGYGLLGFLDDYLKIVRKNSDGLLARFKLIGQFLLGISIGCLVYYNGNEYTTYIYFPFYKEPILDLGFWNGIPYIAFVTLLLTASSNAVNLTDGLDGLATGLTLITLVPFAVIAYVIGRADFASYLFLPHIAGASELSIGILALLGASLGFLWFNSHPARVMMGDTGSLAYGGALGTIAILLKKEILLPIIGGVFVLETLSVILQVLYFKCTGGKRLFRMAPLHHHFELKGWHENQVVNRFWILGVIFALIGLLALKVR
ncbi:phospho-N-acetylmuramoyl-pentapeptide-transferase [Candidatus Haliotispira prima]|uniref:Phospho-N-acetylmuramoyl-pentapeptide-transferase n=1 Tax=Candidatus Haliotispira prima TaxID=3034016 RepID=A0ABY8MFV0_9SPIO|nr:phospho-N-acetylmuramoyl-pentapeptide-transferase [Candidatus Haliotispira prima]